MFNSRKIVNIAKEKGYGIKLEKLEGIRRKKQGKTLNGIKSNWSFYQLRQFVEYKSKLLGVPVFYVAPHFV
jgi:putative transposase